MKVGDYVRTEYGISKIKGIFPERTMIFIETDNGLGNCSSTQNGKLRKGIVILEENYRNFIDNNVKERPIDLIEVGDYVNGHLVIDKNPNAIYIEDSQNKLAHIPYTEKNIKSILTHQQFDAMKYEVK